MDDHGWVFMIRKGYWFPNDPFPPTINTHRNPLIIGMHVWSFLCLIGSLALKLGLAMGTYCRTWPAGFRLKNLTVQLTACPFDPCAPHRIPLNKCVVRSRKCSNASPTTSSAARWTFAAHVAVHHCWQMTSAPWDQHPPRRTQPLDQPPCHPSLSKTPSAQHWPSGTSLALALGCKLGARAAAGRQWPPQRCRWEVAPWRYPAKCRFELAGGSSSPTRFAAPAAGKCSGLCLRLMITLLYCLCANDHSTACSSQMSD